VPASLEVVEGEALSLSVTERSRLVEQLLASLESDPTIQGEWLAEGERRYQEFLAGGNQVSLGSEVHSRLRASIQ
jgi:putative addiction module component (TIGR02574 family)